MLRRILLICGIGSSIYYVAANVVTAALYPGYSVFSGTVSELSAVDAPTRGLWVSLMLPYTLLGIGFGAGVWSSAGARRSLRIVGALLVANAVFGVFWPPMHQRAVLAAHGGTLTDTLHLVWGSVTSAVFLLVVALGAAAFGRRFRVYSIATIAVMLVFGGLTGVQAPRVSADLPTPWLGIWERLDIAAYLAWVVALALRAWPPGRAAPERPHSHLAR